MLNAFSIDYYGGFVPAQKVSEGSKRFSLPAEARKIIGWQGALSGFGDGWFLTGGDAPYYFYTPGMHCDTWLSTTKKEAGDKAGKGVFGILKTSDAGHAVNGQFFYSSHILLAKPEIFLNWWIHNMRGKEGRDQDDWHVGYGLYY
jgi:hypothetical protein